jgi:hypothetical protein
MSVFYYMLLVHPHPDSGNWGESSGAYASCWVRNASFKKAYQQIEHAMTELGWVIESIEERKALKEHFYSPESAQFAHYQEAKKDGSHYILHTWPNGAADEKTQ